MVTYTNAYTKITFFDEFKNRYILFIQGTRNELTNIL